MGFEFHILNGLQTIHTPFLDTFMKSITKLGDAGIVWIILTVILLLIPKTRKAGVYMALALIVDLILCNVILKPIVARTRPYNVNKTIKLLVPPLKDYSFPSGHTAASFTSVSALYFAGRKKMAAGALVLSIFIAFSRLYLYVHYPTDVLGGLIIGLLCGWIADLILKKISQRKIAKNV